MLSTEEYRAALVAARDEWHSKNHPFFTSWAKGELTKDAMKAYVQQHYNFVSNASRYYGIIYGLCPWWDARNFYLENLNEEEDPNERHVDKLAKFGNALGMTVEESRNAPDLPTTAALKDYILNTALTRGTLHATAVIIVGLESQVPQLYEPIVPALRDIYGFNDDEIEFWGGQALALTQSLRTSWLRAHPIGRADVERVIRHLDTPAQPTPDIAPALRDTYGFTDDEIEFFLLHITADVEHGEKGFQILLEHTDDPKSQQEVIETVREAAKKRWFYMDGMYREYVEGRPWYPVRVPA